MSKLAYSCDPTSAGDATSWNGWRIGRGKKSERQDAYQESALFFYNSVIPFNVATSEELNFGFFRWRHLSWSWKDVSSGVAAPMDNLEVPLIVDNDGHGKNDINENED